MFSNVALDVVIGLVFIFLLYSLLASIIQEIFARLFSMRARTLMSGIRRMLEDDKCKSEYTLVNFFSERINDIIYLVHPFKDSKFLKEFYKDPNIKYLGENGVNSKPSYITPERFSKTLIHMFRKQGYNPSMNQYQEIRNNLANNSFDRFQVGEDTKNVMMRMLEDANQDVERFKIELESWFNDMMDRVSGWYKKKTQFNLFVIGFIIAVSFNVDTIAIVKLLAKDEAARSSMVQLAISKYESYGTIIANQKDSIVVDSVSGDTVVLKTFQYNDKELDDVKKSLETDIEEVQNILGFGHKDTNDNQSENNPTPFWGWLITALAICLGAPFWFDLLNKIMLLRETGKKPSNSNSKPENTGNNKPIVPVG